MRLLFVLIFLLSLPVLLIAHRQHYSTNLQGPLLAEVGKALEDPEFAQVKPSLTYMDVTLQGRVANLTARERAQLLVDDIRGLRCRAQDNFIQISAKLTGKLTDHRLALTGWLHDETVLRDATRWLASARPGLEISTENVVVNPHVTIEGAPGKGGVPAPFRSAWTAIEVPSTLKIVRDGSLFSVSGNLTASAVKSAVIAAMTEAAGPTAVDATQLESGVFVREAKFASEDVLPAFLKAFFRTPGAVKFEADASVVRASGYATPTMQREWLEMLEPVSRNAELHAQFQVHPSVYHFPGRTRESAIQGEAFTALRDVLLAAVINFDPGYTTPQSQQQPKITVAANAIAAAGPDVRIVVGGHVDLAGNPKDNAIMAKRRAEGVAEELVSKGVSQKVLETTTFEAVPGGADRSREVEILIK